jgi:hypothetical protein
MVTRVALFKHHRGLCPPSTNETGEERQPAVMFETATQVTVLNSTWSMRRTQHARARPASQDEQVEFETVTQVTVTNITAGRRSSSVSFVERGSGKKQSKNSPPRSTNKTGEARRPS